MGELFKQIATTAAPSATAGLFGLFQQGHNKAAQNRQNLANRNLAEYQYSKELEMWNKQNEYNSPQAQMQRFKDAGLNPNLIYGQGNAGNATVMPRYQAPTQRHDAFPIDFMPMISMFTDTMVKQAQRRSIDADTKIKTIKALSDMKWLDLERGSKWYESKERGLLTKQKWSTEYYSSELKRLQKMLLEDSFGSQLQKYNEDAQNASAIRQLNEWQVKFGQKLGAAAPIMQALRFLLQK